MVFTIQKMRKYLNYRHFRIDDPMADDFFEKSGLIGYYDQLELKRSDHLSDDGYFGRIIFFTYSNVNIRFKTALSTFTCEQHPVE